MLKVSVKDAIYIFEPEMSPAASVKPGEVFKVETDDCFCGQIKSEKTLCSEIDFDRINPATGPIRIEGAEPGDTLAVEIIGMDLADHGVAVAVPGEGLLGDSVERPSTKIIPIKDGQCLFSGLSLPVKPMIGVIGVAPEEGAFPTGTPWSHGGNMDTKDIGPGAILYLPVRRPGALLAMGDCHAVMGDGEVCCSGCEVATTVTLRTSLIKGRSRKWPILETSEGLSVIVSGEDLDSVLSEATSEAVDMLKTGLGLSWEDAYVLSSLVMDLRISQLVDPKKTVRGVIPKGVMSPSRLFGNLSCRGD
jgi:amidase